MATTFEALTLKLKIHGCTNSESINYDSTAEVDNGMCIDAAFTACIEDAVFNSSLKDCELDKNKRYLEVYTYYQSLLAALEEKNKIKIDMYKDKLAELCNAEYCESC
tara:strand:- start:61 stop:381 length:321 start_codon:yes stop_codon:yes gene_type:complete